MSVGYPADKATIDQRVGALAFNLRATLDQIQTVKTWLDSQTDAQLNNLGYSGSASSGDVQTLRNSFTDMDNLRKVARGLQAQPAASDFFFNAKNLTGLQ
jgi:hypothetical protein